MATVWIPTSRFLAVLDECSITKERLDVLADRKVRELRTGRQEAISLDAADRILTKLGLTEWMHLPKDQGGLGDLYFGEETFIPSWVAKAKAQLDVARTCRGRRYATAEEAAEANRARTRRRSRSEGKRCKCGTPIVNAAQTCRPCHLAAIEPPHGSVSRYTSKVHNCRCDLCTAASAAYHRERQRAMRAAFKEAQRRAA